jgi:hypothetical protein
VSDYPECSAKACRAAASWLLVWNNPRLHQPDYEKRWLACDDHRGRLSSFLGTRGLLRRVEPLPPPPADQVPGRTAPK